MGIQFSETRKDLPVSQLRALFMTAGWSTGNETPDQLEHFNIGFVNATLVDTDVFLSIPCKLFTMK